MVAHLLRLKLTLLRNSLKRSPWQLVGLILGALYGLGVVVMLLIGLAVAGSVGDPAVVGTAVILAGSALLLGWLIVPVLASGLDMTLDPARFTTYSIPMKSLLTGLALSSFLGVPGAVTLIAGMGTAVAWWREPLAAAAALLCGALGALTCIIASRAITAASTSLASSRRFKDVSGILILVPLMLLGPIIGGLTAGLENFSEYLPQLAQTLSWTPLGAIWAVPAHVAAGAWSVAGLQLLIAVATLVLLTWIWQLCMTKALVTPAFAGGSKRKAGKLGFFTSFPPTPTGAVAARCLSYWIRDPRYSAGLIIAPLLPLVMVFVGWQSDGLTAMGPILGYGGALAAFLVAWSISSDISYDSTAFALHVATGVSGTADRTGRAWAAGVLALPIGFLFVVVGAGVSGDWVALGGMLGLVLTAIGAGLGLASILSSRFTMNVPLPGESPMKSRPGNNFATAMVQLGGFLGAAVLIVPVIVVLIIGAVTDSALYSWLALVIGIVLGAGYALVGIRLGATRYNQRAPELLQAVSANR